MHMSDQTHALEQVAKAVPRQHSLVAGMKGTLRFFAPSIIVGLAAPFVFPAMRRAFKPVTKGLIKGALSLGESMKEGAAEAREHISDLLVEVRAEREQEAAASLPAKPER
jgi:hypothetical protein